MPTCGHPAPVARARFRNLGDDAPQTEAERDAAVRSPFAPEIWLTTRYDDGVATLLDDDRFSVDPLQALTPEQPGALPDQPKEFLPLSRSLLTLDPPDHTRLRKLVQPWFTGRAIDALRPRIARSPASCSTTPRRPPPSAAKWRRTARWSFSRPSPTPSRSR